jgi:hypothetical protein
MLTTESSSNRPPMQPVRDVIVLALCADVL